jgi:hypothetical protein
VVSDDSDRNFDGNGPRTGVVVTFQVGVAKFNEVQVMVRAQALLL